MRIVFAVAVSIKGYVIPHYPSQNLNMLRFFYFSANPKIPNHYTVQPFREQYIQVIVAAVIVDEYKTKVNTRRRRRQLNLGITAAVIIYKKCLGAAQRTCTDVADEFTATTHPPNTA